MSDPADDDGWGEVPPLAGEALPTGPTSASAGQSSATAGKVPAPEQPVGPGPSAAPAAVSGRPAPQYGEYAPEGWVNPVFAEQSRREREAEERRLETETAARRWTEAGGSPERFPGAGAVPPSRIRTGTAAPGAAGRTSRRAPRDTAITVILLVVGLVSVVQQVTGISAIAGQVAAEIAARYTSLAHPGALVTASAASAIVSVVLLLLAGWWSVVRLRHHRMSFWVPLVAGALSGLVSTVLYVIVVMHDPSFVAYLAQHPGGV